MTGLRPHLIRANFTHNHTVRLNGIILNLRVEHLTRMIRLFDMQYKMANSDTLQVSISLISFTSRFLVHAC